MTTGEFVLVAVTFILVCITAWYAWETRLIVKNMERDREASHRPLLSFQVVPWDGVNLKLRIQNVGGGPAFGIEGKIEAGTKHGVDSFPWSYPFLGVDKYEEFGFPMPEGTSTQDRFSFEKIRERISVVRAIFKYSAVNEQAYELNDSIPIAKVTKDWVDSKMLVTADHPDRIMPRIAKFLEEIIKELKKSYR